MNTTEERLEIQDTNIKNQASTILLLQIKYRGVQERRAIEEKLKQYNATLDYSKTNADWFKHKGCIEALEWILSAEVEEEMMLQRKSNYGIEHFMLGPKVTKDKK
jgi:hypothetical protein